MHSMVRLFIFCAFLATSIGGRGYVPARGMDDLSSSSTRGDFSENFSTTAQITHAYGLTVDTSARNVKMRQLDTTLPDENTLLLSHLGSNLEISNPAIGVGGSAYRVNYAAGQLGNAASVTEIDQYILFPIGDMSLEEGTISVWANLHDWADGAIRVLFNIAGEFYLFKDSNNRITFQLDGQRIEVSVRGTSLADFAPNSWHHFVLSYDFQGLGEASIFVDGVLNASTAFFPFTFETSATDFYVGNSAYLNRPWGGIDELRITSGRYSPIPTLSNFGILEGGPFDTGVANPVWGDIGWQQELSSSTGIQLQTSTSDDGVTWDGWLNRGMVSLLFDDMNEDTYTNAKPSMDAFDFKGSFSIVPGWVGVTEKMTMEQIQDLIATGWAPYTEGYNHTVLTTLTPAELADYVAQTWQYFVDDDLPIPSTWENSGGTPGTASTPQQNVAAISQRFSHAMSVLGPSLEPVSFLSGTTFDRGYYNNLGKKATATLDEVKGYVDDIAARRSWTLLYWHHVGTDMSIGDYGKLMAYLNAADVDVVTLDQAYDRLAYRTPEGSQITSPNKRYIRYRAILSSFDQVHTPTLKGVQISAPHKVYKDIATTIKSDGDYEHAVWPQTTDTLIDQFSITPNFGSVTVNVETWDTFGTTPRRWTESGSAAGIITSHTIGDLVPGNYYRVKVNGQALNAYRATADGQIHFSYVEVGSTVTFEIDRGGNHAIFLPLTVH